jgi:NADH-quinone oxidoreductase subunit E
VTTTSEATRERVRKAIKSQKQRTITVLSSLHAAQDELGYLPVEAIEEVADFTSATTNEVWGVASFYTNFRFTPPGEHVVEVCWGPTCHLLGAAHILKGVLDTLRLSGEGETQDNKVTFKYNTCLGACSQAPVMSIDHRLVGRLTVESARRLVEDIGEGGH